MEYLGAILLLALGGLLAGGAYSFWTGTAGAAEQGGERNRTRAGRYIAAALALSAVLAVAGGVLRLDYLPF